MHPAVLVAIVVQVCGQTPSSVSASPSVELEGVARIRSDAKALADRVTTDLAKEFLSATSTLPPIPKRMLYLDPVKKTYVTEADAARLDTQARHNLKPSPADETFYYNTKYGSPLAYSRPLEVLGRAGIADFVGRKVLDFGYGGVGPLRLLAAMGADVVGVDVDPMLPALYSQSSDQGIVPGKHRPDGHITLINGHYPSGAAIKAKVGGGYDVILAKNTLKRGYVHPEGVAEKRRLIDLGMDDASFLRAVHNSLKPGGWMLIYNLCPAPSPPGQPYKPWADGRSPFSRTEWEKAGFRVEAFDKHDSTAARVLGHVLGWDRGEGAMDLEKDLFATYTLVRKPSASSAGGIGRIR
jgi:hypothetical protein